MGGIDLYGRKAKRWACTGSGNLRPPKAVGPFGHFKDLAGGPGRDQRGAGTGGDGVTERRRQYVTELSGASPGDYEVYVRDSNGDLAVQNGIGCVLGSTPAVSGGYRLRKGDAVGTWFPLDEMFDLRAGQDYTVVVAEKTACHGPNRLVATPLGFRAPRPRSPAFDRPLYGSTAVWQRLLDQAGMNRSEITSPKVGLRITPTGLGELEFAPARTNRVADAPLCTVATITVLVARKGRQTGLRNTEQRPTWRQRRPGFPVIFAVSEGPTVAAGRYRTASVPNLPAACPCSRARLLNPCRDRFWGRESADGYCGTGYVQNGSRGIAVPR